MNDRIYIENGQVYREDISRSIIGSEASILMALASNGQLTDMGMMFHIRNRFSDIMDNQPKEKSVRVLDSSKQRIFLLECNEIPLIGHWKINRNMTVSPKFFRNDQRLPDADGLIYAEKTFIIPQSWASFLMFIVCDTAYNQLYLKNVYLIAQIRNPKKFNVPKYSRTGMPNNFPDCRICLGEIGINKTENLPRNTERPLTDSDFVQATWEYIWESKFNHDLNFNIDWATLDMDMNVIPLEKNEYLMGLGAGNPERGFIQHLTTGYESPIPTNDSLIMTYVSAFDTTLQS